MGTPLGMGHQKFVTLQADPQSCHQVTKVTAEADHQVYGSCRFCCKQADLSCGSPRSPVSLRLEGSELPCKLSLLMAPRKATDLQFVLLLLVERKSDDYQDLYL